MVGRQLQAQAWGFDLADIAVPVLLLYGGQDAFVPIGQGQCLAQHIPGVEAARSTMMVTTRW
jgi:pimeloyl-ACP methyl ester carboxylesterase